MSIAQYVWSPTICYSSINRRVTTTMPKNSSELSSLLAKLLYIQTTCHCQRASMYHSSSSNVVVSSSSSCSPGSKHNSRVHTGYDNLSGWKGTCSSRRIVVVVLLLLFPIESTSIAHPSKRRQIYPVPYSSNSLWWQRRGKWPRWIQSSRQPWWGMTTIWWH